MCFLLPINLSMQGISNPPCTKGDRLLLPVTVQNISPSCSKKYQHTLEISRGNTWGCCTSIHLADSDSKPIFSIAVLLAVHEGLVSRCFYKCGSHGWHCPPSSQKKTLQPFNNTHVARACDWLTTPTHSRVWFRSIC